MAFRPPSPYDTLVQQLLQNVQRTTESTERGLMAQREERLIGEEAQRQQERIEQQRAWQQADYSQQREDQLSDRAETHRLGLLQRFQELIGYVRPDSDKYQAFQGALSALSEPTGLVGRQAWDHVASGRYMVDIDGQPQEVNIYGVLSDAAIMRDEAQRAEGFQDFVINQALAGALDTTRPEATRLGWMNSVVGAGFFTNEQKDQFLQAAGVADPEDRHEAIQQGRLLDLSVQSAELQVMTAATTLGQMIESFGWERDWHTWEYGKAQERWEMEVENHQNALGITDRDAFINFGVLPPEGPRRERLARGLNMEVSALEGVGEIHWRRFQRRENLTTRALEQSLELTGVQIKGQDLMNRQVEYDLNRAHVFGVLEDKRAVAEWALVAATNGDVEGVAMLEALADDPAYARALADIDFATLKQRAIEARGDADEIIAFNRRQRELQGALAERGEVFDIEASLETLASTYMESDFSVGADGSRPALEAEIRAWTRTLSQDAIESFGVENADELVEQITNRALKQRVLQDRSEAASRLQALLSAPWPDNKARADAHAALIADTMLQTGLYGDPDDPAARAQVSTIIEGMQDDAQRTKFKLDADARHVNQQADLLYAQTISEWYTTLSTSLSGGEMDLEAYQALLDMAIANQEAQTAIVNSGACSLTTEGAAFVGDDIPYNHEDPVCADAHQKQSFWAGIAGWLASGVLGEDGEGVSLTAPPPGTPGVPSEADPRRFSSPTPDVVTDALATRGWNATGFDFGRFYYLPPEMQAIVLEGIVSGGARDLRDVNAGIMAAIVDLYEEGVPTRAEPESIASDEQLASIIQGDAYRNASPEEKAGIMSRWSQEWLDLADKMARGELSSDELQTAARQFGFMRPRSIGGRMLQGFLGGMGEAIGGPEVTREQVNTHPDTEALAEALLHTANNLIGPAPRSPQPFVPGNTPETAEAQADPSLSGGAGYDQLLVQLQKVLGVNPATSQGTGIDPSQLPGGQPAPVYAPDQPVPGLEDLGPPPQNVPPIPINEVGAHVPAHDANKPWARYATVANAYIASLVQQESGGNHLDPGGSGAFYTSPKGAFGIAQLMPATAMAPGYNVTPLRDHSVGEHLRLGRDYLAALLAAYNGNVSKALAAYNHGPGNVNKLIEAYGSDWLEHAPAETRNYVADITGRVQGSGSR